MQHCSIICMLCAVHLSWPHSTLSTCRLSRTNKHASSAMLACVLHEPPQQMISSVYVCQFRHVLFCVTGFRVSPEVQLNSPSALAPTGTLPVKHSNWYTWLPARMPMTAFMITTEYHDWLELTLPLAEVAAR
jgi:hypothetical protein